MDLLTELTRANHDSAVIAQVRALLEQSVKAEQLLVRKDVTLAEKDFKIAALTLELAHYRRIRFGKKSEAFNGEQRELFEETIDTDLAAVEAELVRPTRAMAMLASTSAAVPGASRCRPTCRASNTATNQNRASAPPVAGEDWRGH